MFINQELQKQVLVLVARPTGGSSSADAQQRGEALLRLTPGQQVKAEVIATLPNSLYLARIAGKMCQLEIPLNIQPGETMQLTFLTAEPRLTFSLTAQEGSALSVRLSPIGKWLAGVLKERASPPAAQEPLLEGPPQGSALLAARLKAALSLSGLFYEAHLAKWASGGLPLAEILREPQAKLRRSSSGTDGKDGADGAYGADGGEAETRDLCFADERTLPLVKEQLQLLNTGRLVWEGEAWPGQGMVLTVTEREEERDEAPVDATVALELPRLGAVRAKLNLAAEGLSLELVCERPGVAELLKEKGEGLRLALASVGLHLRRLAARDDQETE